MAGHGFGLLLWSLLAGDLSGEAGDGVGGRTGGSSHENLLTGGRTVSRETIMVGFTHAVGFLNQTP